MSDVRYVRACAVSGIVFTILIIVGGPILSGNSPSTTDSASKVFHYIATHQGDIKAGAALAALAMVAVLIWVAAHFGALRKAEGGRSGFAVSALAGGILAASATVVASGISATTALRIHDLTPTGARVFFVLGSFANGGVPVGLAVLTGASAVVMLTTGLYSRWLAWVTLIIAVLDVLGIASIAYANGAAQAFGAIGPSLTILWILAVSIYLLRKPDLAIP